MAQLNRSEIILKIQELSFACVDLNLYLDTHPDDANAVNMYNSFSKQLNEAIRNYECKYGPLTILDMVKVAVLGNGLNNHGLGIENLTVNIKI